MTVFSFADGLTVANFDVDADVLAIDAVQFGAASGFRFNLTGDNLTLTSGTGATATLTGVSYLQITTSNIAFNDGSGLLVGDGTTDVFADSNAQNFTTSANTGDFVLGGTSGDTIAVDGTGSHTIFGNSGVDDIDVSSAAGQGTGANTIRGGAGDDLININTNATGNNTVWGDLGADTIVVDGTGNNAIFGDNLNNLSDSGADTITINGSGTNTVNGMNSGDTINVETTAAGNFVRGGAGNDTINLGSSGDGNIAWGDLGDDTIDVDGSGDYTVFGDNVNNLTQAGVDTITVSGAGANLINGMNGNDDIDIAGTATGANTVRGGAGNDAMDAAAGVTGSIFKGDNGNDTITFAAAVANNTIEGGEGDDAINWTGAATGTVTISGGAGIDTHTIDVTANANTTARITDFVSTDKLIVGSNAVDLDVAFAAGQLTITDTGKIQFTNFGTDFTSTNLTTGAGVLLTNFNGTAATLTGAATADQLIAGDLGDRLISGGGADELRGGNGADTFVFADDTTLDLAATVVGGTGTDTVEVTDGSGIDAGSFANFAASVEALTVGNTAGTVTLGVDAQTAGIVSVSLTEPTAATAININVDAYTTSGVAVTGGAGANVITGGAVVDTIDGGAGADTIQGKEGNDSLTGGTGADTYIFEGTAGANGNDTITDFGTDDLLDFAALATDTTITATVTDTSTAAVAWATNDILVVTDADGNVDTAAEVAALFGAGKAFEDTAGSEVAVVLVQGNGHTTAWAVNTGVGAGVAAGEVAQVADLVGYTTTLVDADFV